MKSDIFDADEWYRAMTLSERVESRQITQITENPCIDVEKIKRRLKRWKEQSPFGKDGLFQQRLALDGITEDELFLLLGETDSSLRNRFTPTPSWISKLAKSFKSNHTGRTISYPEHQNKDAFSSSLILIEPLIKQGRLRLRRGISALLKTADQLSFYNENIEEILFTNFPNLLMMLLSRTLVLELNIARLEERLNGDTPEERFRDFFEQLRHPDKARSLLKEYPVLSRHIVGTINHWVNASLEFLTNLRNDWVHMKNAFSPADDPGNIISVKWGAGDTHRGGRTVMIVSFQSGLKLVYKPRPVAVESHFQDLLSWVNGLGIDPSFRTINVLDCITHGWIEFVDSGECASQEEIKRFYKRQGAYLALLYALEATDFHFENLIAAGEHPVLIDIESLFHPRVDGIDVGQDMMDVDRIVGRAMTHSVLRIGLLPMKIWGDDESEGVDISGVGGAPNQMTPKPVPYWEDMGTDKMHLKRKKVRMPGSMNRPSLNGLDINVLDYSEAIEEGFENTYRLLLSHRDELLSSDGPLALFAEDEIRVILRATQTYALLLHESFHPDVLRDGLDRDRFLDRLWIAVENRPYLAKVIKAERSDLQSGDIPIFTTRPNSCDIYTSDGTLIPDFFDEPSLNHVRNRVSMLDEVDLRKQLWFIKASMSTLAINTEPAPLPAYALSEPHIIKGRDQLIEGATVVGDRLVEMSIRDATNIRWIGLTLSPQQTWTLSPIGLDLYDGLSGIALFFGYLGSITQEQRYTEIARVSLLTISSDIKRAKNGITTIGGFNGWGGIIYAMTHLATLWNEPHLLDKALVYAKNLQELIEKDRIFDIISGSAGCIGALTALFKCTHSIDILDLAIRCADRLIDSSVVMNQGIGWKDGVTTDIPLTGFSHGAAGVAWALLKIYAITHERRFHDAAVKALMYERSLFSPSNGNWPDLRDPGDLIKGTETSKKRFMGAWCHGAPGIGMGRLDSLAHYQDDVIETEIDIAIATTRDLGFAGNQSLCHGSLGNLDLLLLANQRIGWGTSHDVAYIASQIMETIAEKGWICGVPRGLETPALMTGIAGIGYQLLRLAEPEKVPSVLILEPPHLNQ